jgi:hypothetical protein
VPARRTDAAIRAEGLIATQNPRNAKTRRRAGLKHPAEGRGNSDWTSAVSPNSGPFRKT